MATLEEDVLLIKKDRNNLVIEYPVTKYANILDTPTSLKNPTALTFTGGATGTYDGSVAKSVVIPTVPTSLPANGGNADTVGNKRVAELLDYKNHTNVPTSMKSPAALTFTGGVSDTYDGSVAKTVEIPSIVDIDISGKLDKTGGEMKGDILLISPASIKGPGAGGARKILSCAGSSTNPVIGDSNNKSDTILMYSDDRPRWNDVPILTKNDYYVLNCDVTVLANRNEGTEIISYPVKQTKDSLLFISVMGRSDKDFLWTSSGADGIFFYVTLMDDGIKVAVHNQETIDRTFNVKVIFRLA